MADRPHIIIFNPDQWRGDVMGHMGNPAAMTPHLDAFVAQDAVSFRHAYCQNPVCTPSRCSFMSGWYPHVAGHRTMTHMLREHEPTLLRNLKEDDYFVWWGGKNDLVPAQHGFAAHCDVRYAATEADYTRWGHEPANYWAWSDPEVRGPKGGDNFYSFYCGRLGEEGRSGDHVWMDKDWAVTFGAADAIRAYADGNDDRPLCMFIALGYPHPPFAVEDPYYSMIDPAKLPPRTPAPADWSGKPSLLKGIFDEQGLAGWTEDRWAELRRTYYGMCARVDAQFGMVMGALKEAGIYDDSAVFFFSDHGEFAGDYGVVEKTQNTFEDCLTRVPLAIKPPANVRVQPGVRDEAMVELVDFTATVYEVAQHDPGYTHFGKSLLPAVAGDTLTHRDAVFCEGGRLHGEMHASEGSSNADRNESNAYWPRQKQQMSHGPEHTRATMCRTADLKYVRRLYESDELYDLQQDPTELVNVIDHTEYAQQLRLMKDRMLRYMQETTDVVPLKSDQR